MWDESVRNRKFQCCLRRVCGAVLAVLSLLVPATASAADYAYSIMLPNTGPDRNMIYAVNLSTRELEPYSARLRDALIAAQAPDSVLVNSISLGLGTHDYEHWHGDSRGDEKPHFWAYFDDSGRMVALMCHNNDLGDGWEREGENRDYFREFSEKKSYPMGINIVVYAMTH